NAELAGAAGADSGPFIGYEEECAVAAAVHARDAERSAECAAEEVVAQRRFAQTGEVVEEVGRVEGVISQVVVEGAVNIVGAGAGAGVDLNRIVPELGGVGIGQDLELLDVVH